MSDITNPTTNPTQDKPEGGADVVQESSSQEDMNALIDKILAEESEPESSKPSNVKLETPVEEKPKTDDVLDFMKNISGRDFKDREDLEKHYKNLASYVGSKSLQEYKTKSEQYDKLMAEADAVSKALNPEQSVVTPQPVEDPLKGVKQEVEKLREEMQTDKFVKSNPDAEPVLDIIKAVSAQTGKGLDEVYNSSEIKNLLEDRKQLLELQAQSKDLGVNSKQQRLTPPKSEIIGGIVKQLTDPKYVPGRDTDALRQSLVKAYFDIE